MMNPATPTLTEQLDEFRGRKFIAMPLAGAIAWSCIGLCGLSFSNLFFKCMSIFVGTGVIFYLAIPISKLLGEDLLGKNRPKNVFDTYFLLTVAQAVAVYAIAIPFFLIEKESLPLTVGILTGLMWLPFSGFLNHWVGIFHCVARTASILAIWYLLPDHRFTLIPLAIVVIYAITIAVLQQRHRQISLPT